MEKKKKLLKYIIFLIILLTLAIFIATCVGSANIQPKEIFTILIKNIPFFGSNLAIKQSVSPKNETIICQIRLPRIISSVIVGFVLAAAGVIYQGIFRNPMADPYIIGVSSGASLGATIAFILGLGTGFLGISTVSIMAFICAIVTVFIVYQLSKMGERVPISNLILAGFAIGALLNSIVYFLLIAKTDDMQRIIFWMLGGFTTASWDKIKILTIPIVLTFIIIFFYLRELNILTLGDKRATQLGVNIEKIKRILLILASILASLGVAIGGLIAFIGLITPHIIRLIVGSDNRILYPTSALTGSIILIFSDTIARTITSPREIPVGIITAVIGAPYFLYLMKTKGREIFK